MVAGPAKKVAMVAAGARRGWRRERQGSDDEDGDGSGGGKTRMATGAAKEAMTGMAI